MASVVEELDFPPLDDAEQYLATSAGGGPELQALVDLAAQVSGRPMAAINILTHDEQHMLATSGIAPSVCERSDAMCAVVARDPLVVVPDALRDPRFATNPFVTGELDTIRMYASAPLVTADGVTIEDLAIRLADDPDAVSQVNGSLEALDRFIDTVRALLDQDREARETASMDLDLAALAGRVVEHWRPRVTALGREIRHESRGVVRAKVVPLEASQVLDALIRQACDLGTGTVVVDVVAEPSHLGIRVADDSPRRFEAAITHGGDLAGVAGLAEAHGGYVVVDDLPTTRVVARLPRTD